MTCPECKAEMTEGRFFYDCPWCRKKVFKVKEKENAES